MVVLSLVLLLLFVAVDVDAGVVAVIVVSLVVVSFLSVSLLSLSLLLLVAGESTFALCSNETGKLSKSESIDGKPSSSLLFSSFIFLLGEVTSFSRCLFRLDWSCGLDDYYI